MLVSDNELLGLYVYNDDQDAFEKLIRRHSQMVLAVCNSLLWQKADAEDAFQAVFMLLSTKAPKLLKHNSVSGWLHEVAFRTSLKHRGKIVRKREVAMSEELKDATMEPWQAISKSRDKELLHREISRLPKSYRDVIVLCHLEGKSRAQAASVLDVTTASVKASLARGRKLLRHRLLKHGIAASVAIGGVAITGKTVEASVSCVSKSLVQTTLHQCQGFSPDSLPIGSDLVGTGPGVAQSILAKDVSIMTMGLAQSSFAAAAGVVAVCALSFAAVGSQIPTHVDQGVIAIQDGALQLNAATATKATTIQESEGTAEDINEQPQGPEPEVTLLPSNSESEIDVAQQLTAKGFLPNSSLPQAMPNTSSPNPDYRKVSYSEEFQRATIKSRVETWETYVQRLHRLEVITQDQLSDWNSGLHIEVKKEMYLVETYREEQRTRTVPVIRMAAEIDEETSAGVVAPKTENVEQTYIARVPVLSKYSVSLSIPEKGSAADENYNGGASIKLLPDPSVVPAPPADHSLSRIKRILEFRPAQSDAVYQRFESTDYGNLYLKRTDGINVGDQVKIKTDFETKINKEKVDKVHEGSIHTVAEVDEKWCSLKNVKGWLPLHYLKQTKPSKDRIRGYELVDRSTKQTLRKAIDINHDGRLDTWIYFKGGVETYRDLDSNFNGKTDRSQYIKGDEIRYGFDENEDGKIDRWKTGHLSDIKR